MKKHLLAAAVAAALPFAAMAQSTTGNITIYGVIDAGIQTFDADDGDGVMNRAIGSALQTSHLGIRGSEDLGGGLKANFQLQGELYPHLGVQGVGGSTTVATFNNQIWGEELWVGLSGSFGEIRLGKQDVTAAQSIDNIVTQAGNLGISMAIGIEKGSNTAADQTAGVGNQELGKDQFGVIKWISPTVNGFQVQLGHATGNNPTSAAFAADSEEAQTSAYVEWKGGPAYVAVGWQKNDGTGAAGTAATVKTREMTRIGASYNFGTFSVGAFSSRTEQSRGFGTVGDTRITGISAAMPLGNGLTVHGSYQTAEMRNIEKGDARAYVVALTKALSKRTTIYGAFSSVDAQGAAVATITGVTASPAGNDPDAITVGIRHAF